MATPCGYFVILSILIATPFIRQVSYSFNVFVYTYRPRVVPGTVNTPLPYLDNDIAVFGMSSLTLYISRVYSGLLYHGALAVHGKYATSGLCVLWRTIFSY
jgi:hypothetical protein